MQRSTPIPPVSGETVQIGTCGSSVAAGAGADADADRAIPAQRRRSQCPKNRVDHVHV